MNISGLFAKVRSSKIFKNKFVVRLLICLLCIVALSLFASTFLNKKTYKETTQTNQTTCSSSVLEYSNKLSAQIEDLLSCVNGLSNVKAVVVVESSPEIKYLLSGNGDSASIVLEKLSSTSKPVAFLEIAPKIKGILIVAKGTTNLLLKNKVISAISSTYAVDISKIDILEGK